MIRVSLGLHSLSNYNYYITTFKNRQKFPLDRLARKKNVVLLLTIKRTDLVQSTYYCL